jgi:hypothetical protein|tara:strand:- start:2046 stop:2390 length:345 start_codon:yes stop_codon:yes gene_type:complete
MDLDLIRNNLELDFRLKLYKDPCFPFLQSMGKKNIYQEFYLNQKKSIGILHLRWNNKNSELYYMGKNKIEIKGIYESQWFENHDEMRTYIIHNDKQIIDIKKLSEIYVNHFCKC